jgi:hypothetical protein
VQKWKTTATSNSTTRKKEGATKKSKPAPTKLAYDMTDEEIKKFVDAEVKIHFAPKQPQPKVKIDPKNKQHTLWKCLSDHRHMWLIGNRTMSAPLQSHITKFSG